MPYTAITPFRIAVQRIVERQNTTHVRLRTPGYTENWNDVHVLDYLGRRRQQPSGKLVAPGEKFVLPLTELGDGVQGHYLSGIPRGLLTVTEQVDIYHDYRVAVDDLADILCRELDGRSAPGITAIKVGVRSVVLDTFPPPQGYWYGQMAAVAAVRGERV